MAKVTIFLAPRDMVGHLFFVEDKLHMVKRELPRYTQCKFFETDLEGETAAEEAFDLTNNPYRQREREEKYGRGRSVSTGDVIEVDGVKYACMNIGWEVV